MIGTTVPSKFGGTVLPEKFVGISFSTKNKLGPDYYSGYVSKRFR